MSAFLKIDIYRKGVLLETLEQETNTQPVELLSSLLEFRNSVNALLTKMISDTGDSGDNEEVEDLDYDSIDEEDTNQVSPKKRRQ